MTNKERLYKQINKLSALKDGWFGGSGLAPNSNAIDNCKKIIDSLSEDILEHCAVFPCQDSNISFQGKFSDSCRLIVAVQSDRMTYVVKNKKQKSSQEKIPVNEENIKVLEEQIRIIIK